MKTLSHTHPTPDRYLARTRQAHKNSFLTLLYNKIMKTKKFFQKPALLLIAAVCVANTAFADDSGTSGDCNWAYAVKSKNVF
jgi:hypothetical protein